MRRNRGFACALACVGALTVAGSAFAQPEAPTRLRVEYLVRPLGIAAAAPRFSWEVSDSRYGARQSAYEIEIGTKEEAVNGGHADVWDSGQRASDMTNQVEYEGAALQPASRYWWRVRTWDGEGKAGAWSKAQEFGTGLRTWQAQWVQDASVVEEAQPGRNGYHSELSPDAAKEKWVLLDLGAPQAINQVRLWPARPYDWERDEPGFMFPLRYCIEAGLKADLSDLAVVADRRASDQANPGTEPVDVRLTGTVQARFIRLRVTGFRTRHAGEYGVALAEVQALSAGGAVGGPIKVTASDSLEMPQWSAQFLVDGDTASHGVKGVEALPAVQMRCDFTVGKEIKRATAYVSALGVYEFRLNGQRVGDHSLAPEWTDYNARVQYQAYDVTAMLSTGANTAAALVGDGWYAGRLGMAQALSLRKLPRAVYGRSPQFIVQVEIENADGTRERLCTDDQWVSTRSGPIRSADLLDGVVLDERLAMPGWDKPGFDDSAWTSVMPVKQNTTTLTAQTNEPIRMTREIAAVALTEPTPGTYVFDMGQNMPGVVRFVTSGDAGRQVMLRHAEMLNDDGTVYVTNLRGAPQIDRFILRGGAGGEVLEAPFTYHGFRYVEVTGLARKPALTDMTGLVIHSDSPETGSFECSNPMLNRLWQNILWTQRANLMSVPTDCPQRDERLGWMGDICAFGPTACFNMDLAGFITKWAVDVRDAQATDGRYPDFAPHPYGKDEKFTGVPAWGDAGVFVPWCAYEYYGDRRLIEEHYPSAKRWIDWIHSRNADLIWRNDRHNDYNDWLNGDTLVQKDWPTKGGSVPNDLFATAFFARSTEMLASMAEVIGNASDAAQYSQLHGQIREAFQREFLKPDGSLTGDTQAGYALALSFGLIPQERETEAAARMLEAVKKYDGRMSTGFHTSHRLMLELTRFGYDAEAYGLAVSTRFPSWGYTVENGATTIWERWDGYVKGRGFQDPGMNSFNHWAIGSVGEWMYRVILGINQEEGGAGWRKIVISPRIGGGLTWAKGSYRCINGEIESQWKVDETGHLEMQIVVPANCTATIVVPAAGDIHVSMGSEFARKTRVESDRTVFEAPAGRYVFHAAMK